MFERNGALLPPEVAVPLAAYTGWNLRRPDAGAQAILLSLSGPYFPFPRTKAERKANGDPREPIEEWSLAGRPRPAAVRRANRAA